MNIMTAVETNGGSSEGGVSPEKDRKLNFAVISCGGTIGMEPSEDGKGLTPKKSIDDILGEVNLSSLTGRMEIPPENKRELFKLDSSNLNPEHWKQLIREIEVLQEKCDGIIIFHGTDTMAYSATATGLVLAGKIKVPIIFTGSQKRIGETGNDAKSNVERSFLVLDKAARDGVKECMIFFGDKTLRGTNSRKRSEADFEGFETPGTRPLYVTDGMGVRSTWPARTEKDVTASRDRIGVDIRNEFSRGVVIVSVVPGLEADTLMAIAERDTTKAIILRSLGVGIIPALEGDFDLIKPVRRIIRELGKPVILASSFVGGDTNMDVYEVSAAAKEAGVIDAGKMTEEAVLVKTRLILAQPEWQAQEAFRKVFRTEFAGEMCTL